MTIGTAIFWLAALTIAFILHVLRERRRDSKLQDMMGGKKLT